MEASKTLMEKIHYAQVRSNPRNQGWFPDRKIISLITY